MPSHIDHFTTSGPVKCICAHKCQHFSVSGGCFTCYREKISYIKTALQDFATARVIKDSNKAFLVEITERERKRERERERETLNMSAPSSLEGEVYVSGLLHGGKQGDKGGQTEAFMRLTQSKLVRAIPHAEDISSQEDKRGDEAA